MATEERDGMKRSAERLLTTHTGSLPRPAALREAETDGYEEALRGAVDEVVRLQVEAGIDIVSDGEMSKPNIPPTSPNGRLGSEVRARA
jgi:5-methyltetrahydropteroyltriglutamate--homocysteine methyltransferase